MCRRSTPKDAPTAFTAGVVQARMPGWREILHIFDSHGADDEGVATVIQCRGIGKSEGEADDQIGKRRGRY
jgi:hypothetical protein